MPDISMCSNKQCTQRLMCYRYMAMPNPLYQLYADFEQKRGSCQFFIPVDHEEWGMMKKYHEEMCINPQK